MRNVLPHVLTRLRIKLFASFVIIFVAIITAASLVSAAPLPSRSVQLSSASAAATSVTYAFEFTVNASAGAFVVEFCANSPTVGTECLAPAGMSVAGAAITTAGFTLVDTDVNRIYVTSAVSSALPVEFSLDTVTNPSASGLAYARIVTYDTAAHAAAYDSVTLGAGSVDGGAVGFSITDTIGVSASVVESVTFCVSSVQIGANCNGVQRPVLQLGEQMGDIKALSADAVSEGILYSQVSTNASSGVIVYLKSSALNCGGLMRAGSATECDIKPALTTGIAPGDALFGVKVVALPDTGTNPGGVFAPVSGSVYETTNRFSLNFITGNSAGITSTFGDPFLDTAGAPANNKNLALTFGASVSESTPAGTYSADLSLIATGKF